MASLTFPSRSAGPRPSDPHITLMHPRNAICDDATFEELRAIAIPKTLRIGALSLIEQEIEKAWKVLDEFRLMDPNES